MIKVRANEKLMYVGKNAGDYMYVMTAERYSTLGEDKLMEEAATADCRRLPSVLHGALLLTCCVTGSPRATRSSSLASVPCASALTPRLWQRWMTSAPTSSPRRRSSSPLTWTSSRLSRIRRSPSPAMTAVEMW